MVLDQKTNGFPGKRWFSVEKPTSSEEKDGFGAKNQLFHRENQKKTIFLEFGHIGFPKDVFFVFPRKKLVFQHKTIFFLGKSWFFGPKPSFS